MKTRPETEAEIVRLHHAEGWPIGTIAEQIGVHTSVVTRVLGQAGVVPAVTMPRPSKADPYLPFIRDTLEKYPRLRASRLLQMERRIRYIRDNFFAARTYTDLDDLNAQAADWCARIAAARPCPEDRARTVGDAFAEERLRLMPLPETRFPCDEVVPVNVGKTPYVRFDLNDYSVPHTHVRRQLAVVADPDTVRIVDGTAVLATHARVWGRDERVEDPTHIEALVADKRAAHQHRGMDRLQHAAPQSRDFLHRCAERGQNLGNVTWQLGRLLDQYGAAERSGGRRSRTPRAAATRGTASDTSRSRWGLFEVVYNTLSWHDARRGRGAPRPAHRVHH